MQTGTLIGGLTSMLLLTASAAVAQPTFQFLQPYSTPRVGPTSISDISANGSVLTGTHATAPGSVGSYWNGSTRVDYVPPQFATPVSGMNSVSGNGQFVAGDFLDGGVLRRVFKSTLDGTITTYPSVQGSRVRLPNISGDGSIVAALVDVQDAGGNTVANRIVRYTSTTTWDIIPAPASAVPSQNVLSDMSDDGNTIIANTYDTSRGNQLHATVWRNGSGTTWLPVAQDTTLSLAYSVSRNSQVIAGAVYGAASRGNLAIWQNGARTEYEIPTSLPWIAVMPRSITDTGELATGMMTDGPFSSGGEAFVWTATTGIISAQQYLTQIVQSPIPLLQTQQIAGVSNTVVSADGSTLGGTILLRDTQTNQVDGFFFRATIPGPATISVVTCVALVSPGRRRHAV